MAQLRIERIPRPAASAHEDRVAGQRQEFEGYDALLPDETLSSWADRHQFIRLTSDDPKERNFGTLDVDLPGAQRSLLRALRHSAAAPDAWLLPPHQRTLHCVRCLAEDWALGLPSFERRAWSVAWRTCCQRHGVLFDSDRKPVPGWRSVLGAPNWSGEEISIYLRGGLGVVLALDLHRDRRAIHLESALANGKRKGAWFPNGLDTSSLRDAYRAIVTDLIAQFFMDSDEAPESLPNGDFNRHQNPNRFAVNVLAEAILSEWTNTPLPGCASAQSTNLLVRAIGWGQERPTKLRCGQVLFRGPSARRRDLTHYEKLIGAAQYRRLAHPAAQDHWGYFTLPEARRLGVDIGCHLRWLADQTRQGQFLAFDARGGRLTENPALPEALRLQPEDVEPYKLLLPAWAFGPPKPPTVWDNEGWTLLGPRTQAWELRQRAEMRRTKKQSRRSVRFQGTSQAPNQSP